MSQFKKVMLETVKKGPDRLTWCWLYIYIYNLCMYIYIYTHIHSKYRNAPFNRVIELTRIRTWEPLWVLPAADVFLVRLRIWIFECAGLIKSFGRPRVPTSSDNLWKSNFSPKWSRLGVMIGCPNLAANTSILATKFGCTKKNSNFFSAMLHHVGKVSTYYPKRCLSDLSCRIQDFRRTSDLLSKGIAAGHGRIWEKT